MYGIELLQFSSFWNEGKHDLRDPVAHQQACSRKCQAGNKGNVLVLATHSNHCMQSKIIPTEKLWKVKAVCNIMKDGYYNDMHEGSGLSPREIGPPLPQSLGS